ncbi:MAG: hypothetical protein K9J46_09310 [Saprospiraceae bacterium]|nr:hypothetical protein [Saprospiraceae bacterium]
MLILPRPAFQHIVVLVEDGSATEAEAVLFGQLDIQPGGHIAARLVLDLIGL